LLVYLTIVIALRSFSLLNSAPDWRVMYDDLDGSSLSKIEEIILFSC